MELRSFLIDDYFPIGMEFKPWIEAPELPLPSSLPLKLLVT
jgi:hypothetical protein